MAIYTKSGSPIDIAYDENGNEIISAYDVNGTEIYSKIGHSLVVMTYNVGQWYIGTTEKVPTAKKSEYYGIHNHAFDTYRPDVMFLQEALSTWCQDGSLTIDLISPYFDYVNKSRYTTNYQGHYICTKHNQQSKNTTNASSRHKQQPSGTISQEDEAALDIILDKIKKSGYASLTEEEKRRLFQVSKNN